MLGFLSWPNLANIIHIETKIVLPITPTLSALCSAMHFDQQISEARAFDLMRT